MRCALGAAGIMMLVWAPPRLEAQQRYLLRLAPNPGDTLWMRVDQRTEVTGDGDKAAARRLQGALTIFSHAVVSGRQGAATTLLAQTDSIAFDSDDEHIRAGREQVQRLGAAMPLRIRVAADGTVRLLDDDGNVARGESETLSLIPAALPEGALAVGDTWVRSMPLPVGPSMTAGLVHATFRLDSVSRGGRIAYISVAGDLERGAMPTAGPRGTMMRVVGTVSGRLNLDRVRGWIADSRFTVTMHSAVEPPASSGIAPVRFTTVVTQHMRLDERSDRARRRPAPEPSGRP